MRAILSAIYSTVMPRFMRGIQYAAVSAQTPQPLEYWIARSSRAMTGEQDQIFAARSAGSSNRMPVAASIRSISSVASLTERFEVSMVSSLPAGAW